jgi:hypothetical protein
MGVWYREDCCEQVEYTHNTNEHVSNDVAILHKSSEDFNHFSFNIWLFS